jgi:hypothetical protein
VTHPALDRAGRRLRSARSAVSGATAEAAHAAGLAAAEGVSEVHIAKRPWGRRAG